MKPGELKPLKQLTPPQTDPFLEGLNKEQAKAVKHAGGPLLIVAGAGTGKTTVITRRIAYLVQKKLAKLDEIAALTFTDKAAGEMEERVDLLLPLGYVDTWISTFHSFCERILKAHGMDIGLPGSFTILSDTQQWIFIYKNLDKFNLDYYRPLGNPAKFIAALLNHFSRLKDEIISPEDYLAYAEKLKLATDSAEMVQGTGDRGKKNKKNGQSVASTLTPEPSSLDSSEILRVEELANAYHIYQRLLLENGYLDFGDLINYALELFKKRPKILEYYRNKFKYFMVDEFQDTNYAQYQLVRMLASKRQNITVVGDDDQSVYKFRGASVSNILKFKEDYPEFTQVTLVENYRSSQNILDLAYNFIQANNPERLEVKLKINKRLRANAYQTSEGRQEGIIQVLEADDLSGELNCVVKKISELKQSEKCSWNDFAVLIRSNSAANDLLPLFYGAGVPYTFFASRGLYKKPVILDLLSYIKLLDNGHDSNSLYKVLALPKFHLSHADLSELLQQAHKKAWTLFDSLSRYMSLNTISGEGREKIKLLTETLQRHSQQNKHLNAAEMFVHIVKDLGLEDRVKAETLEAAENRELIEQFYKKIENFERQNEDKSLHYFLQLLNLELEAGNDGEIKFNPDLGPESVKVMTVHASKGLEFKYVFVINMVDQRFPTREKSEIIEIPDALIKDILPEGDFHLQEERRLFYVAITRAKSHLYLSWARDYGGARAKKPSVFLSETGLVPSEKVNKATGKVIFDKQNENKNLQPLKNTPVIFEPATKFSYSQLTTFKTCPLQYKYQYYLKLPIEGTCHLSFGQTIHKVFEEYLKRYKSNLEMPQQDLFGGNLKVILPDFKFLEQLYEKHWVDDWYKDKKEKEDYRERGKTYLKTFYDSLVDKPTSPKYIEKFFSLKIGNYDFTGKIDRADVFSDGVVIIDYKTGKVSKKEGKDLDQLYIYQWAAEEYLREKVVGLRYWFLQGNELKEEAVAAQGDIAELKKKLAGLIEEIVYATKHDLFKQAHKKTRDHDCQFEYLE